MSIERIVGIDFGTSTSVIRVRRYEDGNPVDAVPNAVTFNNGSTMVPTLIRKLDNGHGAYYGFDAEIPKRSSTVFRNFKTNLEDPDDNNRNTAKQLTASFFKYLGDTYQHQSETGFLGENDDTVRTKISYPVKWSKETREFMINAAKEAGFPNVEGLDEAKACIQAVTEQYASLLSQKGYFQTDTPSTILLIDMGAGTTDLVLCRHIPGDEDITEVLDTWPKDGKELFGGHVIDEILYNYIISSFPDEQAVKRIPLSSFKAWKETVVSPALERREAVDFFAALQQIEIALDTDLIFETITRSKFEKLTENYLALLPRMISDLLSNAQVQAGDVDLVILTGGHSQWYFVREMLLGRMEQFNDIGFEKLKKDPERIFSLERPQETVALGLVYLPKNIQIKDNNNDSFHDEAEEWEGSYQLVVLKKSISYGKSDRFYIVENSGETTKYIPIYINQLDREIYILESIYKDHIRLFTNKAINVNHVNKATHENKYVRLSIADIRIDEVHKASSDELICISPTTPDCTHKGNKLYWFRPGDQTCFWDSNGSHQVPYSKIEIPAFGHRYEWKTIGDRRICQCSLCGQIKDEITLENNEQKPVNNNPVLQAAANEDFHVPEEEFQLGSIGNGYVITRYLGSRSRVIIPEMIRGRKVVAIGDEAFINKGLTYIEVPSSLVSVGNKAFMNCRNLQKVKMSSFINEIGAYAFYNCMKLEYFDFGSSSVGAGVVTFPKQLKKIGLFAFVKKPGLFSANKPIMREVTLNRQTRIGSLFSGRRPNELNTFGDCAVFYY